MKKLLALLLLLPSLAFAQPGPPGSVSVSGATSVVGGAVSGNCINITASLKLGQTACGGTGTVTAVSVATANGFAGSSSGGATPALTITTSVNSPVLAGNGTAIAAATTTGTGSTVVLSAAPALTGIATGVTLNLTSTSATSFVVGRQGTTTPAFAVDSSTASQTGGLKVTGSALNGTVAVVVTDTSGNTNLTVNALGTGTIGIGSVSTGRVTITPVTTITGALTLSAVGLVYNGVTLTGTTGTGNMVLSISPTFTGTMVAAAATFSGAVQTTGSTIQYLGADAGADTKTITASPALTAYTTGACYYIKAGSTNATTTPTENINALGAKTIVKRASTALAAGDILSGMIQLLCYDGANLQLLNPVVN